MQDNHDVWNNSMDLAGITNGGIVGFKYFGFGGLAQATKGLPAFAGTQTGDGTVLNLNLTSGGQGAFKVHVMLDGPYANSTWNGREIAVIEVPADAPRVATNYQVAVPAVEGLTGKHAIYLVADGPEITQPERPQWGGRRQQRPQGLFDLHGIGFSKEGATCERPRVPQMTITVDGQRLNIPATPIYGTNANGYMECNHYQVYGKLTGSSKLSAQCDDPTVSISVSPIVEGRATVKATWNGVTKIYLIN